MGYNFVFTGDEQCVRFRKGICVGSEWGLVPWPFRVDSVLSGFGTVRFSEWCLWCGEGGSFSVSYLSNWILSRPIYNIVQWSLPADVVDTDKL